MEGEKSIFDMLTFQYQFVGCIDLKNNTIKIIKKDKDIHNNFSVSDYRKNVVDFCNSYISKDYKTYFFNMMLPENMTKCFQDDEKKLEFEYKCFFNDSVKWKKTELINVSEKNKIPEKIMCYISNVSENEIKSEVINLDKEICEINDNVKENIKEHNEKIKRVLTNLSHDIRTPINAVIGLTAIAQVNQNDNQKLIECIKKINCAGKHLASLVDQVLDINRMESGNEKLCEKSFTISQMVKDIENIIKPFIQQKKQKLVINTKNVKHDDVEGDILKLRRGIINILSNSVKYTPEKGTIAFTVIEHEKLDVKDKKFDSSENKRLYEFVIKDNGIGMKKEFLEHVFEPFKRSDEICGKNIQGSGLGMCIVKRIALLMGGDVRIESRYGVGTSTYMSVYLNNLIKEKVNFQTANPLDSYKNNEFKGKNILIAEDNKMNREIAAEIFKMSGINVTEAQNGKEAVENIKKYGKEAYDLIFMDIKMPIMNGLDAVQILRQEKITDVPVIAMTAEIFDEEIKKTKQAGMDDYISKPIDLDKLHSLLKKWL